MPLEENSFDQSVKIHDAARRLLDWVGAHELDSQQAGRALLLAAATMAKASGARHLGWRTASEQAWHRVDTFERWLASIDAKSGWLAAFLNLLGVKRKG